MFFQYLIFHPDPKIIKKRLSAVKPIQKRKLQYVLVKGSGHNILRYLRNKAIRYKKSNFGSKLVEQTNLFSDHKLSF